MNRDYRRARIILFADIFDAATGFPHQVQKRSSDEAGMAGAFGHRRPTQLDHLPPNFAFLPSGMS